MSRWFRHYAGMMRDEKLVAVAIRSKQPVHLVVWIWGAILESAAEIDDNGIYEIDGAEVAYFLRADEADVGAVLDALAKAGRVAENRVVKWGDRQYQSDKSAERQARYRERRRASGGGSDDQQTSRDVTRPSPDGDVTPQETDTESDTETEKEKPAPHSGDAGAGDIFDEIVKAFPRSPHFNEAKAERAFSAMTVPDRLALRAAAQRYSTWWREEQVRRGRPESEALTYVPPLDKWISSQAWREADNLSLNGGALDPELMALAADDPLFKAVERMRGKPIIVGKSGRATFRRSEVDAARAQAPP